MIICNSSLHIDDAAYLKSSELRWDRWSRSKDFSGIKGPILEVKDTLNVHAAAVVDNINSPTRIVINGDNESNYSYKLNGEVFVEVQV